MAVIADQQNQNNQDEDSATSTSPSVTSSTGGGSGSSGGGSSGGSSPSSGQQSNSGQVQGQSNKVSGQGSSSYSAPTSSGSFTNVQNYLNANKGYNSGNGGFAGQTYNNLANQGQNLNNQVDSANTQFGTQSQAGRNQYDQSAVTNALADPNSTVGNAQSYAQFEQSLNGGYGGPQNIANASQLQNQTQNYQGLTNLANNANGRSALLQQLYGSPSYNQGQQNLDSMLLQSNPSQLKTLQSASQLGNAANNNLNNVTNQATQQAQQYQQEAANTNKLTNSALNNTTTDFTQGLNTALTNLQNKYSTDLNNAHSQLGANNVSTALASQLGLNPNTTLYNLNLNDYLNSSAPTLSLNNVASQNDVNKANALDKLANNNSLASLNLNPTAAPSEYNFNNAGFQNALTSAQNNYNSAFNANTLPSGESLSTIANGGANSMDSIPFLQAAIANGGKTTQGNTTIQGNVQDYQNELAANQQLLQNFYKQQGLNNILKTYS